MSNGPDYHKIYNDIILLKYPDKAEITRNILEKRTLLSKDLDLLNELLFGRPNKTVQVANSKHRSYKMDEIIRILKFQKDNKMSNMQTANYFKLSRNTVAHWKKKV